MIVRDTDRGLKQFLSRMEELERGFPVTVGVHADDGAKQHENSKITVGELAIIHEFEKVRGAKGRKRQRGWLRRTVAYKKKQLRKELGEAAIRYLHGQEPVTAFSVPGKTLHEAIIEASGEETGQLHRSMTVRIRGHEIIRGRGHLGIQAARAARIVGKRIRRFYRGVIHRARGRV